MEESPENSDSADLDLDEALSGRPLVRNLDTYVSFPAGVRACVCVGRAAASDAHGISSPGLLCSSSQSPIPLLSSMLCSSCCSQILTEQEHTEQNTHTHAHTRLRTYTHTHRTRTHRRRGEQSLAPGATTWGAELSSRCEAVGSRA